MKSMKPPVSPRCPLVGTSVPLPKQRWARRPMLNAQCSMLNVEQCSMLNVEQCSMLNLDNAECLTLSLSPAWVRLGVHNDGRQDFEHLTGFIDQRCGVRVHLRLGKCDQPQPVARLRALFSRDRGLGNEVALRLTGASFLEVG